MTRNIGIRSPNFHSRGDNSGAAGIEADAFVRLWARGNPGQAPEGRTPSVAPGGYNLNSSMKISCNEEILDFGGGTSDTSVNNLVPANAIILPIVCTPVSDLTTPTTYDVGDGTTQARFGDNLINDDVSDGPKIASVHWAVATFTAFNATASPIKLVANAAGQGKILVQVYYISFAGGLA